MLIMGHKYSETPLNSYPLSIMAIHLGSKCIAMYSEKKPKIRPPGRLMAKNSSPNGGCYAAIEGFQCVNLSLDSQCKIIIIIISYCLERIVKATSPWLNVILLSGIMIRLPATLLFGLSASANHYPGLMGKDLTPLCNVRKFLTVA